MFNYHEPNIQKMESYLKDSNKGEGTNWWNIPSGMSSVRILPPWDPTGRVALPVYVHPIEYKAEGMSFTKYNWTCVNKTFGRTCPICEGLAKLSALGVDTSNWESNRRQFYFNAIVMHDPTYDQKGKGVAPGTHVLMKSPKTFYDWIISQITNPMVGDITSIEKGIDIYITKEGSGLGTSYAMTLSPNGRTAIPKEYLDKIKDLYNIDDVFSSSIDDNQVNELMTHLNKSSANFGDTVSNAVSQMAGHTAPVQVATPQPTNVVTMAQTNIPTPAVSPYVNSAPPTPVTNVPASQDNANPPVASNLPKCYGNYDSGNVNCVVCPVELQCARKG